MWRCPAASGRREQPDFVVGRVTYCTSHGEQRFNMATAVHDTTLQDITSSTSFQTAESPVRSKSCGPDVGRESAGTGTKTDDTASPSTALVKVTGAAVSESKSATAITSSKTKIFDNKIFVEAPIPKTNPWLKSSEKPVNNNKGGNVLRMQLLVHFMLYHSWYINCVN